MNRLFLYAGAAMLALLGGCAGTATTPPGALTNANPNANGGAAASHPFAASSGLADGIALYNKGDYNGAIRRLALADVTAGPIATQLAGLKYSAFSYCVTGRSTLCRQQFDKAIKLDPAFDLAPGEHGHPLWGPVFVKAKKAR